jgi:protein-tyrosine-phosphatase
MDVEVPSSPPDTALTAAAMRGVDMGAHRSQPIHPGSLAGFDMVIAMEAAQSRWLKRRYPEHAGKVFLLPLFDPRSLEEGMRRKALFNIEDPFGKTLEAYLGCYERIERCLEMAGRQLDRNRCK